MKLFLPSLFLIGCFNFSEAQITTPTIKANFGVDADLNAFYFNNILHSDDDDWFNQSSINTIGKAIIDTTGAATILSIIQRFQVPEDCHFTGKWPTLLIPL